MMMSLTKALFLGLATVSAWSDPDQWGAGVSVTKVGINNAKDVAVPYIFNLIKDISIPEVDFDGGNLTDLIIHLPQPPAEDIGINFDHNSNGVELLANGVEATISSNFKYTYWITVEGEAAIKINKLAIDIEVDLSTQQVAAEKAPYLKVQKAEIDVNPDDVDITLTGGLAAKIAGYLIPLLKSSVIPSIINIVQKTITSVIDTDVNKDIYEYGTHITVPELGGVTADYSQMSVPAQVTSKRYFEMAVNGTFYNANHTMASIYPPPVAFDLRNPDGRSLQGHITEWTVNTALEAAYSSDNTLDVTSLLYQLLKINVTTTDLGQVIPQLITKYGENKTIHMSGKSIVKPSFAHATAGAAHAEGWLAITGTVGSSEAFYGEFHQGIADANIHTNSTGGVFGKINTLSIGTIVPGTFRTSLSGVTASSMQTQLQTLVTQTQAEANAGLAVGAVIPEIFGVKGNIEINLAKGKLEAGVDATPATWQSIADLMVAFKERVRYFNKMEKMAQINSQFA